MNLSDHLVDIEPIYSSLIHSIPLWAILSFIIHRWLKKSDESMEIKAQELKEQFRTLNEKLDKLHEFNDLIERRLDAVDAVISIIMKDSFSSSMIARGTGGWPRVFYNSAPPTKEKET